MANHIQIRKVIVKTPNPNGGESWVETWEYRTKDVVASVLGLIPLATNWDGWTRVETVTVDQNGDPM